MTKGAKKGVSGSRYPSLFLWNKGHLSFISEKRGQLNSYWGFKNWKLGKVYDIEIRQTQKNGKVMYEVVFDGVCVYKDENTKPITLENAKVYLSNPWYQTAPANLFDFYILTQNVMDCGEGFVLVNTDQCYKVQVKLPNPTLKKNHLVATLPVIGPTFVVKFKLRVNSLPQNEWTNILHVTKGVNKGVSGARYPSLFLWNKGELGFISEKRGQFNPYWGFKKLKLGKVYDIEIKQTPKDGKMMFEVSFDGVCLYDSENTIPLTLENAKVYLSDPWYQPAPVDMYDFSILTLV